MASLSLTEVTKSFGPIEVVHPLSLEILHKEFLVLVGPSGCGKTTLLRMIAGLEDVTSGTIAIDGRVVNHLQPKDRDIAMVFQDYALYPHMTVYENMAFGLLYREGPKDEIRQRVDDASRRRTARAARRGPRDRLEQRGFAGRSCRACGGVSGLGRTRRDLRPAAGTTHLEHRRGRCRHDRDHGIGRRAARGRHARV